MMTTAQKKRSGFIAGLAERRRLFVGQRALTDIQADPHLARDVGVPHRPKVTLPLKVLW